MTGDRIVRQSAVVSACMPADQPALENRRCMSRFSMLSDGGVAVLPSVLPKSRRVR